MCFMNKSFLSSKVLPLQWAFVFLMLSAMAVAQESGIKKDMKSATGKRILHYKTVLPDQLRQQFDIQIFDSGEVIYTGISNVRTIGSQSLKSSSKNIENLLTQILRRPDPPGAPIKQNLRIPRPGEIAADSQPIDIVENSWILEIDSGKTVKMFARALPDARYDKWLRGLLEEAVSTKDLRCPFYTQTDIHLDVRRVLPKGSDICAYQQELDGRTRNLDK